MVGHRLLGKRTWSLNSFGTSNVCIVLLLFSHQADGQFDQRIGISGFTEGQHRQAACCKAKLAQHWIQRPALSGSESANANTNGGRAGMPSIDRKTVDHLLDSIDYSPRQQTIRTTWTTTRIPNQIISHDVIWFRVCKKCQKTCGFISWWPDRSFYPNTTFGENKLSRPKFGLLCARFLAVFVFSRRTTCICNFQYILILVLVLVFPGLFENQKGAETHQKKNPLISR